MKKLFALLIAMTMLLSAASALAESKEPVTIRFYNYALSETAKADWWKNTVSSFEAANPWVTVEPITVDYNSMIQTFTNDLGSGMKIPRDSSRPCATTLPPDATSSYIFFSRQLRMNTSASCRLRNSVSIV